MRIYIIRHGEAVSESTDFSRPLSTEGVRQVSRVAEFLKRSGVAIDRIWHSGKVRAKETAERIGGVVGSSARCEEVPSLNPNDPVKPVREAIGQLSGMGAFQNLMIAGHLPSVQRLASLLLTGSETKVPMGFSTATMVCLEEHEMGQFILEWVISPEDIS